MPSRREQRLQDKRLIELAALCAEVASNPACDSRIAEQAQALRMECVILAAAQTQRMLVPGEQEEIEAQEQSLKRRIIEFLSNPR